MSEDTNVSPAQGSPEPITAPAESGPQIAVSPAPTEPAGENPTTNATA